MYTIPKPKLIAVPFAFLARMPTFMRLQSEDHQNLLAIEHGNLPAEQRDALEMFDFSDTGGYNQPLKSPLFG